MEGRELKVSSGMTVDAIESYRNRFAEDGVICVRGLLDDRQLGEALNAFNWSIANPGPGASVEFAGEPGEMRQDLSNPLAREAYREMLAQSPVSDFLSNLWGRGAVWFMYEQIFLKEGASLRTPWHQDTPYLCVDGEHLAVVWITFDAVEEKEGLEFCLGSHRGPAYAPIAFRRDDPTAPLYPTDELLRMPDIEAERDQWPIRTWAITPGDVLIFHPSVLHGGGAPKGTRRRRTLSLRYFGEDAVYATRPEPAVAPKIDELHTLLSPGMPFRHPAFQKVA